MSDTKKYYHALDFDTWLKLTTADTLLTWIVSTMLTLVDRGSLLFNSLMSLDVVLVALLVFFFALIWTNRVE